MTDEKERTFTVWQDQLPNGNRVTLGIDKNDHSDQSVYLEFVSGSVFSRLSLTGEAMQSLTMLYAASLRHRVGREDLAKEARWAMVKEKKPVKRRKAK